MAPEHTGTSERPPNPPQAIYAAVIFLLHKEEQKLQDAIDPAAAAEARTHAEAIAAEIEWMEEITFRRPNPAAAPPIAADPH